MTYLIIRNSKGELMGEIVVIKDITLLCWRSGKFYTYTSRQKAEQAVRSVGQLAQDHYSIHVRAQINEV